MAINSECGFHSNKYIFISQLAHNTYTWKQNKTSTEQHQTGALPKEIVMAILVVNLTTSRINYIYKTTSWKPSCWVYLWGNFPDRIIWGDTLLMSIFWSRKTHFKSGPHLLVAAYIKAREEGLALCLLVHSFTGVRVYFFGIPGYTEDQLRHPSLWTQQPLDS